MAWSVSKVFQLAFQRAATCQKASDVAAASQKPSPTATPQAVEPASVFCSLGECELPQVGAKRKAQAVGPANEVGAAVQTAVQAERVATAASTATNAVNAATTEAHPTAETSEHTFVFETFVVP